MDKERERERERERESINEQDEKKKKLGCLETIKIAIQYIINVLLLLLYFI
jgi:hypothetical protein